MYQYRMVSCLCTVDSGVVTVEQVEAVAAGLTAERALQLIEINKSFNTNTTLVEYTRNMLADGFWQKPSLVMARGESEGYSREVEGVCRQPSVQR